MRVVRLKPGRARALWFGHPWVFADSVADLTQDASGGAHEAAPDWVRVEDSDGRTIGHGFLAETSAIRVRILERGAHARSAEDILARRIGEACALRERLFPDGERTTGYRLVHAEGDGLPGLIVDRWGPVLVAQFATQALHRRREFLASLLLEHTGASQVVMRPGGYEAEEGIESFASQVLRGDPAGDTVWIREEGCEFAVDPLQGQKTGHYADQRESRCRVAQLAAGLSLLDLYCGTGGFSLQALRAGADSSLAIESSPRAAECARGNATRNKVGDRLEIHLGDVRETLRALRQARRRFDLVVLDPPDFFPARGSDARALHAYREMNVRALSRVGPAGGFLATFSCSPRLPAPNLLDLLRSAARECRRTFSILRELEAGPDHPVNAFHPLGRYLSGFLLRVEAEVELSP